MNNKVCCVQ